MNENEINVLLDHFVGGLDSTESASVTQKINSLPVWSKTYKQISCVFGSLKALKEQDSQQSAPAGLANKTFQKILEQQKTQQAPSQFFAQKSSEPEQTVNTTHFKRFSVKPSFLALSACTGFLLVFVLASLTFNYRNSSANYNLTNTIVDNKSTSNSSNANTPSNTDFCGNFAVTGTQQPSSSFFFCTNAASALTPVSYSNNNRFAINSSEDSADLVPSSFSVVPEQNHRTIKMACPDRVVVFVSQPEGRPIIIVQPHHFPRELNNYQDVGAPSNVHFVTPVNFQ